MNKIGFKNFRRFTEFPVTEYGGITFLVGKNNSGKSTMVKALMLIIDFLKSKKINKFSFGSQNIEDVNIVTFERALNNEAKRKKEDLIGFHLELDDFIFDIEISGELDRTTANVQTFKIQYKKERLIVYLKPENKTITVEHLRLEEDESLTFDSQAEEKRIKKEIAELQKILDDENIKKNDSVYFEAVHKLNSLRDKLSKNKDDNQEKENTEEGKASPEEYVFTHRIDPDLDIHSIFQKFITEYSDRFDYYVDFENILPTRKKLLKEYFNPEIGYQKEEDEANYEESSAQIEKEKELYSAFDRYYKERFNRFSERYQEMTNSINYKYLGAKLEKQSALFAIRDKNNSLSQAIFEYKQLGIDKAVGNEANTFVNKWMSKENFDIGDDIEITLHAGEAYEVNIITNNEKIALADNGTGSIQAMLLILRLATAIYKKIKFNTENIVIIEEPELNLHPALQSKLADLFYEVYDKYGIRLIIETHSEYLTRKSQVVVAEKELEVSPNVNPFKIYYFPEKGMPYKIDYKEDGSIYPNFGEGFYDVASLRALELMKIKKQKS